MTDDGRPAIRDLLGSFVSLPWAMSLFACEQFARLAARGTDARDVEARLYTMTKATEARMTDTVWAVFTVGDSIQRGVVDWVGDTLAPGLPERGARLCSVEEIAGQAADCAETWLSPGERAIAMSQLRNSLEVFNLVKHVRDELHVPPQGVFALEEYIARAGALGSFPDLWAIEGLGHDYADRFAISGAGPVQLLRNEWARSIPRSSLTMLHAGIGLSFAQRLLPTITPYDPPAQIRAVLEQYVWLCQANAWPGYEGAAFESLGLVARTWHPQLVDRIDEHLAAVDERVRECFWHGAGRALYFHPLFMIPGVLSPWRAVDREPMDEIGRLNMKSGLAWATTLVNLRQPRVLARLLRAQRAAFDRDDAFTSGLVSALVMAQDITPHDRYIEALGEFTCADMTGDERERWERMVVRPAYDAAGRIQPLLSTRDLLGEVFRYHPYPEWFDATLGRADASSSAQPTVH